MQVGTSNPETAHRGVITGRMHEWGRAFATSPLAARDWLRGGLTRLLTSPGRPPAFLVHYVYYHCYKRQHRTSGSFLPLPARSLEADYLNC